MRASPGPRTENGFTLVELLVVVGIITLLIAVLLPALARAREHANRIKCAANLHSIGHALVMYVQQYRYYPGMSAQDHNINAEAAVWPTRLRPFLGGGKDVFYCPSQDPQCRWTDGGPEPFMPARGIFLSYGYEEGEPLVHFFAHFSYGYNGWGVGERDKASPSGYAYPGLGWQTGGGAAAKLNLGGERAAGQVKAPEDMVAIADSTADGHHDYLVFPQLSADYALPGKIHGGGANVLFCDGHVQWYLQHDIDVDDGPGKRTLENAWRWRRWNYNHKTNWDGQWQ
jgi:prepilin-type processing-associated H-X9-DG protein/prepilin-type N-terminal cleavage/methylation domain-containing protein